MDTAFSKLLPIDLALLLFSIRIDKLQSFVFENGNTQMIHLLKIILFTQLLNYNNIFMISETFKMLLKLI